MGFRLAYGTFAKSSRFMRLQKGKKSVFARISRRMASKALHFVNENISKKKCGHKSMERTCWSGR